MIDLHQQLFPFFTQNKLNPNPTCDVLKFFESSTLRNKYSQWIDVSKEESKEFYYHILTLVTICKLGTFKSFEQIPEIKNYLEQFPFYNTVKILQEIASLAETKNIVRGNNHFEIFDSFTEIYLENIKKEKISIWNYHHKKNKSFSKILDGRVGQYISKNIPPQSFVHAFNPKFSHNSIYLVDFDSTLRSILNLYDNDKVLMSMYESSEVKTKFTSSINLNHWNYLWRNFKIEPNEERLKGINEFLNHLKQSTFHDLKIHVYSNIDSWQKKSSKSYFEKQVEDISSFEDVIIDVLPSTSIFIDLNNVKNLYKKQKEEKKFRDAIYFQNMIVSEINKNICEDNAFFCFNTIGNTVTYNNFDYLTFTFLYKPTQLDKSSIDNLYKKVIIHILSHGDVNKNMLKSLSEELILSLTIPSHNNNTNKPTIKF